MLVTSGDNATAEDIRQSLQMTMDSLDPYALDVVATIINRSHLSQTDLDELRAQFGQDGQPALIYAVPNDPTIGRATMGDVKKGLNAEVLFGENRMDTMVGDYLVAAMHVDNFLRYIAKDQLIISPGDRTDILLAAIASRLSSAKPDIAGVLLTGGLRRRRKSANSLKAGPARPCPFCSPSFTPTGPSRPCRKSTASSNPATCARSTPCWASTSTMSTARKSPVAWVCKPQRPA